MRIVPCAPKARETELCIGMSSLSSTYRKHRPQNEVRAEGPRLPLSHPPSPRRDHTWTWACATLACFPPSCYHGRGDVPRVR